MTDPTPEPIVTLPVQPLEVGLYLYKKVDVALPAAWGNSGPQNLIVTVPGNEWFTAFPGELPEGVCGPGWAVQQDLIEHDGSFVWPETITYPDNVLSRADVLVDAIHQDLAELVAVPECVTEVPVVPPAPPMLAETGFDAGVVQVLIWVAAVLTVAGFVALVARWSFHNSPLPIRKRRKGV